MAIALVVSASGFYRVVYFVSIGYAFSVSAMALAAMLLWSSTLSAGTLLQGLALTAYGLRLGGYVVARERAIAYENEREDVKARGAGVGLGKKSLIWPAVSLLYVMMVSPLVLNLEAGVGPGSPLSQRLVLWSGLVVMITGLLLEAVADLQKSRFKRASPNRFCDVGLYRWVRCPNYLGEIVFWLGNWAAGLGAYAGAWQAVVPFLGLVAIVLIMIGSTKRLEKKQQDRYGDRPDFQEYVRTVPILFPWVPVYSLSNVRVYLE
jgi:steroid 5-alpha reductase family enzyme